MNEDAGSINSDIQKEAAAGFFIPLEGENVPLELKKDLQLAIAEIVKKNLEEKGLSEEDILGDFETQRRHSR